MLGRILILITVFSIVELTVLVPLTRAIGFLPLMAILIVTGSIGAWYARKQGLKTLSLARERLSSGQLPTTELLDGLLILIAAVLLIAPGVISDALGFLLLFKFGRRPAHILAKRWMGSWIEGIHPAAFGAAAFNAATGQPGRSGRPSEAEGVVIDAGPMPPPRGSRSSARRPSEPVERVYRDGDEIDLR